MSYCEIYCERVYDLLAQDGKDCPILQDYDNRVYVKGLVETDLKSMDQFDRLYATASTNRSTATTGQNDR
jgi:hypothetical protein